MRSSAFTGGQPQTALAEVSFALRLNSRLPGEWLRDGAWDAAPSDTCHSY